MAKFKVGDRVRILNVPSLNIYERHYVDCEFVVGEVYVSFSAPTVYKLIGNPYFYSDKELELVEPKEDKPYKKPLILTPYSRTDILVNGKVKKYSIEKVERPCNMPNEPERLQVTFIEHTEKLPSQELSNQDPFKLNPHEFGNKIKLSNAPYVLNEDGTIKITGFSTEPLKKLDIPLPHELQMNHRVISGLMTKTIPVMKGTLELVEEIMNYGKPKNRIPDRVVFNEAKGKVTVLISKHLDGVAPYWAYTSKVHGESGDKFDAQFGFLLSYYKYLIRRFDLKVQKEMIERIFKILKERRYVYLLGVVENEVLKINGVESYKDWEDIYLAITDPSNANNVYNYTWDYAEWKEMLRVHELETKREEQKAIRKEIKKHEQEIEKLKKKGV